MFLNCISFAVWFMLIKKWFRQSEKCACVLVVFRKKMMPAFLSAISRSVALAECTLVGHSTDGSDIGASLGQSKTKDKYCLCCAGLCVFEGHALSDRTATSFKLQ